MALVEVAPLSVMPPTNPSISELVCCMKNNHTNPSLILCCSKKSGTAHKKVKPPPPSPTVLLLCHLCRFLSALHGNQNPAPLRL